MIDIKATRVEYNDVIIDDIIWIRRNLNLAGIMTGAAILREIVIPIEIYPLKYEQQQLVKN